MMKFDYRPHPGGTWRLHRADEKMLADWIGANRPEIGERQALVRDADMQARWIIARRGDGTVLMDDLYSRYDMELTVPVERDNGERFRDAYLMIYGGRLVVSLEDEFYLEVIENE